jgi:rhodanese-related sulfurtransferase
VIGAVTGILVVTAAVVAFGAGSSGDPESPTAASTAESSSLVSAGAAAELISSRAGDDSFVVLDVRTPQEFAEGHIEDAVNIDVEDPAFGAMIAELDPGATYVVYCRSGNRSAVATSQMRDAGFDEVYDVEGGVIAWTAAGQPLV